METTKILGYYAQHMLRKKLKASAKKQKITFEYFLHTQRNQYETYCKVEKV